MRNVDYQREEADFQLALSKARGTEEESVKGGFAVIVSAVILFIVVALFLWCGSAKASSDDIVKERVVNAIIGEAEGEPYKGKLAIACGIINRVQTYGTFDKAMKGVYGEYSTRVKNRKYSSKVFVDAVRAYYESLEVGSCDFIDGADHWEGTSFKRPYWSNDMVVTATIGHQRFYRRKDLR